MTNREEEAGALPDAVPDGDLEAFLEQAAKAVKGDVAPASALNHPPGESGHRRLRVVVSPDLLGARLEAVFADTTFAEVRQALRQSRVVWGVQEEALEAALQRADRTGRVQRDVPAARGKPAVYLERKEIAYPFLEGLRMPDTGEPLHRASAPFQDIAGLMRQPEMEAIQGYGRPVVAVAPGQILMRVHGKDMIEPGRNVYGKIIRRVQEAEDARPLRPGTGINLRPDGCIVAEGFGYISIRAGLLSVVSPIWISPDHLEAYFVNPPQIGARKAPGPKDIQGMLRDEGICFGIDGEAIAMLCEDLVGGTVREACIRIARGKLPALSKEQIRFSFEPLPPARFESVRDVFESVDLSAASRVTAAVPAVHAGEVIARQSETGVASEPGTDVFGESVVPPEETRSRKLYKAGVNVRREILEGKVRFVSEIYGYAGVLQDRVTVVSPLWVSPDRMAAHFLAFPQPGTPVCPTEEEVDALLEQAQVRYGVDRETIQRLCREWPAGDDPENRAVALARGTPAEPGSDGVAELLFKKMPDPGKVLEGDRMDFKERDAVPQIAAGDVLARRTFPTPGKSGMSVRGRVLPAPRSSRDLLYAGSNVTVEEKEGAQIFTAVQSGWARVVKDKLSVVQRFRHRGNVDYKVGNLQMEGDVELEGTVKSGFKVVATGDVYVGGAVERGAQVTAEGDVVVCGGILGATVTAGNNLYARFIQESEVKVGGDLLVRNFVQDARIEAHGKATVQGNEGGQRQLCLVGGALVAVSGVEVASIGSAYGRKTWVQVGVDPASKERLKRYQDGMSFCDARIRQVMRGLGAAVSPDALKASLAAAVQQLPPEQRDALLRRLSEVKTLRELRVSLEHHIEELAKETAEIAGRARIRVTGTAFQGVTVQIGDLYRALDRDVNGVVFGLARGRDRIVGGRD